MLGSAFGSAEPQGTAPDAAGLGSFLCHRSGRCGLIQPRDTDRDSRCDEWTKLV